jgi:hypothetical protein
VSDNPAVYVGRGTAVCMMIAIPEIGSPYTYTADIPAEEWRNPVTGVAEPFVTVKLVNDRLPASSAHAIRAYTQTGSGQVWTDVVEAARDGRLAVLDVSTNRRRRYPDWGAAGESQNFCCWTEPVYAAEPLRVDADFIPTAGQRTAGLMLILAGLLWLLWTLR